MGFLLRDLVHKPFVSQDLGDLVMGQLQKHILRFYVCVDDPADPMQIVQAHQYLGCDGLDDARRNSFVPVELYDLQQVDAQDLEDHADMLAIRAFMHEVV